MVQLPIFLFLAVGAFSLFTFLAVAVFAENRAKERMSYHRHETLKRLAEASTEGAERVLAMMREQERSRQRKVLEGLKLGGLIAVGVGLSLPVFLYYLDVEDGVPLVGLIPLLVGMAMLTYALVLAPRPERGEGPSKGRRED